MSRKYTEIDKPSLITLSYVLLNTIPIGWSGSLEELENVKSILAPFNIVYLDDFTGTWGMKPIEVSEKIKVLIVPSSDDEKEFSNCNNMDEALALKESEANSASVHEFDSIKDAELFLKGYNAGVGYLGDGLYFSNKELNVEQV